MFAWAGLALCTTGWVVNNPGMGLNYSGAPKPRNRSHTMEWIERGGGGLRSCLYVPGVRKKVDPKILNELLAFCRIRVIFAWHDPRLGVTFGDFF